MPDKNGVPQDPLKTPPQTRRRAAQQQQLSQSEPRPLGNLPQELALSRRNCHSEPKTKRDSSCLVLRPLDSSAPGGGVRRLLVFPNHNVATVSPTTLNNSEPLRRVGKWVGRGEKGLSGEARQRPGNDCGKADNCHHNLEVTSGGRMEVSEHNTEASEKAECVHHLVKIFTPVDNITQDGHSKSSEVVKTEAKVDFVVSSEAKCLQQQPTASIGEETEQKKPSSHHPSSSSPSSPSPSSSSSSSSYSSSSSSSSFSASSAYHPPLTPLAARRSLRGKVSLDLGEILAQQRFHGHKKLAYDVQDHMVHSLAEVEKKRTKKKCKKTSVKNPIRSEKATHRLSNEVISNLIGDGVAAIRKGRNGKIDMRFKVNKELYKNLSASFKRSDDAIEKCGNKEKSPEEVGARNNLTKSNILNGDSPKDKKIVRHKSDNDNIAHQSLTESCSNDHLGLSKKDLISNTDEPPVKKRRMQTLAEQNKKSARTNISIRSDVAKGVRLKQSLLRHGTPRKPFGRKLLDNYKLRKSRHAPKAIVRTVRKSNLVVYRKIKVDRRNRGISCRNNFSRTNHDHASESLHEMKSLHDKDGHDACDYAANKKQVKSSSSLPPVATARARTIGPRRMGRGTERTSSTGATSRQLPLAKKGEQRRNPNKPQRKSKMVSSNSPTRSSRKSKPPPPLPPGTSLGERGQLCHPSPPPPPSRGRPSRKAQPPERLGSSRVAPAVEASSGGQRPQSGGRPTRIVQPPERLGTHLEPEAEQLALMRPPTSSRRPRLSYDMASLDWDPDHCVNKQATYCYCGGPGSWCDRMVTCSRCSQWFHERCLAPRPLAMPITPGDVFWLFVCSLCNGGTECLVRMELSWQQLVHLSLFHLTMKSQRKFHHFTNDLVPFFLASWDTFQLLGPHFTGLSNTQKVARLGEQLRRGRSSFERGSESGQRQCLWGLRHFAPPGRPRYRVPQTGVLHEWSVAAEVTVLPPPDTAQPPLPGDLGDIRVMYKQPPCTSSIRPKRAPPSCSSSPPHPNNKSSVHCLSSHTISEFRKRGLGGKISATAIVSAPVLRIPSQILSAQASSQQRQEQQPLSSSHQPSHCQQQPPPDNSPPGDQAKPLPYQISKILHKKGYPKVAMKFASIVPPKKAVVVEALMTKDTKKLKQSKKKEAVAATNVAVTSQSSLSDAGLLDALIPTLPSYLGSHNPFMLGSAEVQRAARSLLINRKLDEQDLTSVRSRIRKRRHRLCIEESRRLWRKSEKEEVEVGGRGGGENGLVNGDHHHHHNRLRHGEVAPYKGRVAKTRDTGHQLPAQSSLAGRVINHRGEMRLIVSDNRDKPHSLNKLLTNEH